MPLVEGEYVPESLARESLSSVADVSCWPVIVEARVDSSRPVHVGFVVTVALEQVSVRALRFYPVSIIPPIMRAHSFITDAVCSQQLTASLSDALANH
jgi:hypothetical protein